MKNNNLHFDNRLRLAKKNQAGLSMIELLISSVIGVFLIAGIITNFVGTKDSERMRAAMSEMDANARVAMDVLRQTISLAGYLSIKERNVFPETFYSASSDPLENEKCRDIPSDKVFKGSSFDGIRNRPTQDGASDQITVVYMADNPCKAGVDGIPMECKKGGANEAELSIHGGELVYYDCLGGGNDKKSLSVSCSTDSNTGVFGAPTKAKIYSAFYLDKGLIGTGVNKRSFTRLACLGSRSGEPQPLVDDVENIQIRYGVTVGDDIDTATTQYLTATEVENEKSWQDVSRVQIALLMRSSIKNVLRKKTKNYNKTDTISNTEDSEFTYDLLGQTITINNKDRRIYRVYSTTIVLANSSNEFRKIY